MRWEDLIITGGCILAFFGAVKIISDGIQAIRGLFPMAKISERTEELEKRADAADKKFEKLNRIINAQSKLLIEMTTHMLTGNDVEKLTKRRDELTDEIIDE